MKKPPESVYDEISRCRAELSASERKVADLILTIPELPVSASMRVVARRAGVSDATVLRFCRNLGFSGYSEFRMAVARDSRPEPRPGPATGKGARTESSEYVAQLADQIRSSAEELSASEGFSGLQEIAARLAAADITYVFAFGASCAPGWDFVHQLHYFGLKASLISDPHVQALRIRAMNSRSASVFLSIGFSRLMSEMAEAAREMECFTVAITSPGTPLSATCDRCILLPAAVSGQSGPPIQGRYAQLLALDAIADRVADATSGHESIQRPDVDASLRFHF